VTSNSERRTLPVVTYTLIGLNVLMFLVDLGGAINSSTIGRSYP